MNRLHVLGLALAGVMVAGCAGVAEQSNFAAAVAALKGSFQEQGIAKLDRLEQTEDQRLCSDVAGGTLAAEVGAGIEKRALATVKPPSDGKYLGDWREGEKIAQNGRGMQFSDQAGAPNGGNCYACHQLQSAELSYGNLGPSLLGYGKLRGTSEPILTYTWGKIWNSHAYSACSNMPKFGASGILTEKQIKDVMALLLSPESPVNR